MRSQQQWPISERVRHFGGQWAAATQGRRLSTIDQRAGDHDLTSGPGLRSADAALCLRSAGSAARRPRDTMEEHRAAPAPSAARIPPGARNTKFWTAFCKLAIDEGGERRMLGR